MLGVQGAVVKAHGSSNAKAIRGAIRQAYLMASAKVAKAIEENIHKQNT